MLSKIVCIYELTLYSVHQTGKKGIKATPTFGVLPVLDWECVVIPCRGDESLGSSGEWQQ